MSGNGIFNAVMSELDSSIDSDLEFWIPYCISRTLFTISRLTGRICILSQTQLSHT